MLLPGGVTKGTGLEAALEVMELSAHNTVCIGDAENDHVFLAMSECGIAVANAIPALKERADHVTQAPDGQGVIEFIDQHLVNDCVELIPRLPRHRLPIGETADGEPVALPAHGTRLLIVGPSGSGKTTLTGALVERIVETGRSALLIDPEGDYQTLADLERVVVLGGTGERALPTPDELVQLLRHPKSSLVLNLSAMTRAEKVAYATKVLGVVVAVRSTSGAPHWVILDEAHHVLPADGSPGAELLRARPEALCMITLVVEDSTGGGNSGCNHYGGIPHVTVESFRLDEIVATARACEDARLMDQESDFLAILAQTSAWEIEDGMLHLRAGSGEELQFGAAPGDD